MSNLAIAVAVFAVLGVTISAVVAAVGRAGDDLPAILATQPWAPLEEDDEEEDDENDGPDRGPW